MNKAPDNRRYFGSRSGPSGHAAVMVLDEDGRQRQLNPRFDLRRHSPDGFQWGYEGSGPAQLALALVADALGDDRKAVLQYQDFKVAVVSKLSGDEWQLNAAQVREALR